MGSGTRQGSGVIFASLAGDDVTQQEPIVFVVDDDESVRNSLRRLLTSVGLAVEVFATAQAFLERASEDVHGCLVLDVQLPDLNGLELQTKLAASNMSLPIVFLTGHGDIPMTVKAIKAGAVEFLTKPFRQGDLVDAIRNAIERDRAARAERRELAELRQRYESLTPRERDVMARIVNGMLNKRIAAEFGTSESTVKEQRGQVMTKMQVMSLAELVRIAGRLGVVPTE
jgi:FixJ family two-component response regulator